MYLCIYYASQFGSRDQDVVCIYICIDIVCMYVLYIPIYIYISIIYMLGRVSYSER